MLTRNQTAVLHVAKRQLGLDDENYRAILKAKAGVESAADLNLPGFYDVMEHFGKLGFKSTWKKRNFGARPGMASPSQIGLIRGLFAEWADNATDPDVSLNHWLDKSFGVTALRFVDSDTASKAITALKRMTARKQSQDQN
ncbi:regulatory protein GemA [Fulvimarina sp. MAC3]|uniref:regulatory protein GemA n=1 Tax=Fulvimarina sp. MAC3 TaxID=3148887 RepID=UPI0031FDDBBD